ncbi:MAG: hypothetical protein RJA76_195 [Bacteroidota bacterium]|jgi:hypothetical protein
MENYIQQLIADLNAACRMGQQLNKKSFSSLEESIDEIESYFGIPNSQFIYEVIGLSKEWFPAYDQLTIQQMYKVNQAFEKCLQSWNIIVDLPKSFPVERKYQLLISSVNRKVAIMRFGYYHLEFCDQLIDDCPLGPSHCSCQHFYNDLNHHINDWEDEEEWT